MVTSPPLKPHQSLTNSLGMVFVQISPGDFLMGTPHQEVGRQAHEGPRHMVVISHSYWMAIHPVTQRVYQRVLNANPSFFQQVEGQDTNSFPVEQVLYDEALAFCQELSTRAEERAQHRSYRLPTEAEWEYACRAGTTTAFNVGDTLASDQANFDGWHPYGNALRGTYLERASPVGTYAPNAWGLYDMHGNVWEWTTDWHAADYYARSELRDPRGPEQGIYRVLRGGSWRSIGSLLRSGERACDRPTRRHVDHGFRVVCQWDS